MGLFGEIQSLNNCVKKKLFSLKKEDDNICPKPLQGAIINYLYENKKKDIYQKDLEIAFNISKAAISDVLNTMEKNEMIERVQSNLDARYKKIILTKKAFNSYLDFTNHLNIVNSELEKSLTKEELDSFIFLIHKISNYLRKDDVDDKII